jgi:hypothetical protein
MGHLHALRCIGLPSGCHQGGVEITARQAEQRREPSHFHQRISPPTAEVGRNAENGTHGVAIPVRARHHGKTLAVSFHYQLEGAGRRVVQPGSHQTHDLPPCFRQLGVDGSPVQRNGVKFGGMGTGLAGRLAWESTEGVFNQEDFVLKACLAKTFLLKGFLLKAFLRKAIGVAR